MADYTHPTSVLERTTVVYEADIQDEAGTGIPAASLADLTWKLYDLASGQYINARTGISVLNANGGTVDTGGNFSHVYTPEDMAFVGTGNSEVHVSLYEWTYNSGRKGKHRAYFTVVNEPKVS